MVYAFTTIKIDRPITWALARLLLLMFYLAPVCAQAGPAPQIITFVAPVYPQLAAFGGVQGTIVTHIKIGMDGRVKEADVVTGHALFTKNVLAALKQWRFAPSLQEYALDVTSRFEFYSPDGCFEKDDGRRTSAETMVSANLPTDVLIRVPWKCVTITTSDPVERKR